MPQSIRKTAATILLNIEKNGAYVNVEMNKLRSSGAYDNMDIRLIGEIVNGVIKRKLTLDHVISIHSSTKLKKIAPFVLSVLRVGVYQLLFMDKIPPSAAVDECVKVIKKSSVSRLSGYVNAVLRAVSADDITNLPSGTAEALSIKYSYPLWLCERWINEFGYDFALELMESLNKRSPLYVRCNPLKISPSHFESKLKMSGIVYSRVAFSDFPDYNYSFCLSGIKDINLVPGYKDGEFYVQDPSASLAAYVLEAQKNECIIDLCAAPGGKSLFLAALIENSGDIISCDIYDHKIKLISENAQKYGAECVKPTLNDATHLREDWIDTADRVLCDVPCSGFGIIRKKPDIKYSRRPDDIAELSALSMKILDNGAKYLKVGGTLVYSTCTIEKQENEDVINAFLQNHPEFSISPIGGKDFYTAYPNITDTDGFFICRLKKNGVK